MKSSTIFIASRYSAIPVSLAIRSVQACVFFVHGWYNIYFRVSESEAIILHVTHSSRDIGRLSFDTIHQ